MPIYDYTYQSWKGERRGPLFRWLAIPKFTIMEFFGNKMFIWLFSMAWFQFLFRLAWVYLVVNSDFLKTLGLTGIKKLPEPDAYFFKNMIDVQVFFCVAFAFMLGANLISRDLAHNALVLYVSKPISRWEYFFGKFSVVFFLSLLLTWVQTMVLFVLLVAASPEGSIWRDWHNNFFVFKATTLYCVMIGASLSLLILGASSCTRNGRKAGLVFAIFLILVWLIGFIMDHMTQTPNMRAVSPLSCIFNLGFYLFDLHRKYANLTPWIATVGLVGNWALAGTIIYWRMNNASKYGR